MTHLKNLDKAYTRFSIVENV